MELFWWADYSNFGDSINPYLYANILNTTVRYNQNRNIPHVLGIGSIAMLSSPESVICGSGVISPNIPINYKPKKVLCVRGPKSKEFLDKLNIECPGVYGDPTLLLPKIYNPNLEKEHEIGIMPHYVDSQDDWVSKQNCFIIDVRKHPIEVLNDMLKCKFIISSGLHGLIVSDAYNIPNSRIRMSDKLVGGDFKFIDYELSVNKKIQTYDKSYSALQIKNNYQEKKIDIDLDLLHKTILEIKNHEKIFDL